GGRVPTSRRASRWTRRHALFTERHHQLRPHGAGARAALATHGCARSAEWNAAIRADDCVPLRTHPPGLARRVGAADSARRAGPVRRVKVAEGSRSRTAPEMPTCIVFGKYTLPA